MSGNLVMTMEVDYLTLKDVITHDMEVEEIVQLFKDIENDLCDTNFTRDVLVAILSNLYIDKVDMGDILEDDMKWIAGMFK